MYASVPKQYVWLYIRFSHSHTQRSPKSRKCTIPFGMVEVHLKVREFNNCIHPVLPTDLPTFQ